MKNVLLPIILLAFFASCRHQQAVTSASPSSYTAQQSSVTTTTTSTTTQQNTDGMSTTTTTTTVSSGDTTSSQTVNVNNGGNDVVTTVDAGNAQQDSADLYRVTVSFISKGEGIDYKTQEIFENWLKNYPKTPAYVKTHWGREGETNYCLKLNELSTREQEIFVRNLRTLLTDKELVFVKEYAPCKGTPE